MWLFTFEAKFTTRSGDSQCILSACTTTLSRLIISGDILYNVTPMSLLPANVIRSAVECLLHAAVIKLLRDSINACDYIVLRVDSIAALALPINNTTTQLQQVLEMSRASLDTLQLKAIR